MPRPLLIFSESDRLIQVADKKISYLMTNSEDSDQLEPTDLHLHCLCSQDISGFSRTRVKSLVSEKDFLWRDQDVNQLVYVVTKIKKNKHLRVNLFVWAAPCENVSSGICGQRRPRSVAQSYQGLSTKTRLFKYTENFAINKNENFQTKNSENFQFSALNIDCGYTLEPPRRGGSNVYPQSMFWAEIRKIM